MMNKQTQFPNIRDFDIEVMGLWSAVGMMKGTPEEYIGMICHMIVEEKEENYDEPFHEALQEAIDNYNEEYN